jgi:uncharacterized protein
MRSCGALGLALLDNQVDGATTRPRAIVLLETACGAGDVKSCSSLGTYYAQDGTSARRAADLLNYACQQRDGAACRALGELSIRGGAEGLSRALSLFRKACHEGDGAGCELLGHALWKDGFSGDAREAYAAFARGCERQHAASCHWLALAQLRDPATRDVGLAALDRNCQGGFSRSCMELSVRWAPVLSPKPSCERSLPYAAKACAGRLADGCAIEAVCSSEPYVGAAKLLGQLEHDCQRGVALACFYWANAQESKIAALTDATRIRAAYAIACRSESPGRLHACVRSAAADLKHKSSAADAEPQIEYLRETCSRGMGEACCRLSREYTAGKFVHGDPVKAGELRARACELGFNACCATPEVESIAS